jgi:hypothetical protein
MSTIGTQTLTVNTVSRDYQPAWVAKYAADLKNGNTAVKKAAITDGVSLYRLTHAESKGIERHILSLEDTIADSDGEDHMVKVQITLSCEADDSAEELRLNHLTIALCDYLKSAGVVDSVLADEL